MRKGGRRRSSTESPPSPPEGELAVAAFKRVWPQRVARRRMASATAFDQQEAKENLIELMRPICQARATPPRISTPFLLTRTVTNKCTSGLGMRAGPTQPKPQDRRLRLRLQLGLGMGGCSTRESVCDLVCVDSCLGRGELLAVGSVLPRKRRAAQRAARAARRAL